MTLTSYTVTKPIVVKVLNEGVCQHDHCQEPIEKRLLWHPSNDYYWTQWRHIRTGDYLCHPLTSAQP